MTSFSVDIKCPNCAKSIQLDEALTDSIAKGMEQSHKKEIEHLNHLIADAKIAGEHADKKLLVAVEEAKREASKRANNELEKEREKMLSEMQSKEDAAVKYAVEMSKASDSAEFTALKEKVKMMASNEESQKSMFDGLMADQRKHSEKMATENKKFYEKKMEEQKLSFAREAAENQRGVLSKAMLDSELKEKEQTLIIEQLTKQVDAMKETTEKKSQQLQGEALELLIEDKLMREPAFRLDTFSEVKKGANGVDVNITVQTALQEDCGTIMIEAKRAANWSDGWIAKIKKDRIEEGAKEAVCLIVSTWLKDETKLVEDLGEGVWATTPEYFIHFIEIIRKGMIDMHRVHKSNIDRGDKKEVLYSYVHSDDFRTKVRATQELHENIYGQGIKIMRSMKKMMDTISKGADISDTLFVELGSSAEVNLVEDLGDVEPVSPKSKEHKLIEMPPK